jgi:hypothetical protein
MTGCSGVQFHKCLVYRDTAATIAGLPQAISAGECAEWEHYFYSDSL